MKRREIALFSIPNVSLRDRDAISKKQLFLKTETIELLTLNMAPTKETYIYLCNCDNLCDLNEVEELLKAVEKKLVVKTSFKIVKGYFSGGQISDMVNETIPNLKMDYAVFVVHAGECCLSFSEDSGHGKIYEALTN